MTLLDLFSIVVAILIIIVLVYISLRLLYYLLYIIVVIIAVIIAIIIAPIQLLKEKKFKDFIFYLLFFLSIMAIYQIVYYQPGPDYHQPAKIEIHVPSEDIYNSEQQLIDEKFRNLPLGFIIFNPSSEMTKGVTERVEVRIANATKISNYLMEGMKGRGQPQHKQIKVAEDMEVELKGDAFNISPRSGSSEQRILDNYTQWEWDVTPLEAGDHTLLICVVATVKGLIADHHQSYPVLEKEIHIEVDYLREVVSFIKKYLKEILGSLAALISTAAVFIWNVILDETERERFKKTLRAFLKKIYKREQNEGNTNTEIPVPESDTSSVPPSEDVEFWLLSIISPNGYIG